MSPALSVAATLSPAARQEIGIEVMARTLPISHLADKHQVSRKFIYQQGDKAQRSLDESFSPMPADDEVLFAAWFKTGCFEVTLSPQNRPSSAMV